jgi:hypothetical protein
MDMVIDPEDSKDKYFLYYAIPALFKRNSNLPNKSTFRDFYPYELRPNSENLRELRKATKYIIAGKVDGEEFHLKYNGMDHTVDLFSIAKVIGMLSGRNVEGRTDDIEYGPRPLLLDPVKNTMDSYGPMEEGSGYYARSSVLIPSDYLIEKFISIEAMYIGDFEYHFGFPVSFLMGLFSYDSAKNLYPESAPKESKDEGMVKGAEFFLYTPFSLKNFSGVSEFMESVARMILMDILDQGIFMYEKEAIELYYWNTKLQGLYEGKDVEKYYAIIFNIALDLLYMAIHSNYYAWGATQTKYIKSIRETFFREYEDKEGDAKFINPKYGFHPETVASYILYPFVSMIYAGFLSGFSPTAMINYGQTVFRTFVAKQLRWFRYSWPWMTGQGSRGFYWYTSRYAPIDSRHNLLYFAKMGAFKLTQDDIQFLKKSCIQPLEKFISDYDSGGDVRIYATPKDRRAAEAYIETLRPSIDFLDDSLSYKDLEEKYPGITFTDDRFKSYSDKHLESMTDYLKSFLFPYVESHEEKEYSPFPHLFSNRGLFKHYIDPYAYKKVKEPESREYPPWKELEYYSQVFEKNPLMKDISILLSLLSPPLTQAIDEMRYNILLDDSKGGIGGISRNLIEYYFSGFTPRLPFRPMPLMLAIPADGFDFPVPSGDSAGYAESLDIPLAFEDGKIHLKDFLKLSYKISHELNWQAKDGDTLESLQKRIRALGDGVDFHPYGYNYYYHLASNTGNFFYNGAPVVDLRTGEKASLYIEPMNMAMFESSYEGANDKVYMDNLSSFKWYADGDLNNPPFRSDEIFKALNEWRLFKDEFVVLLGMDMLLMAGDDYKSAWSLNHNGLSPNAYQYCKVI